MNEPRPIGAVSAEEFRRLRDIFESALDRPAAERARLIEDACAGDAALIAEVERMLRADGERHRFLDGSVLSPVDRFRPGDTVATHLQILEAIGRGGMGEVYRAQDTRLGRNVAVKVLPHRATGPSGPGVDDRLARFRREAQVLASLNHPNIAAIYGLEEAEGVHALVLELVEGPTLAERIAEGPVPVDQALPIARQIAEALEAAHERGVVHRDLKPANIKLRPDGTVKVLDFGLAKVLQPEAVGDDVTTSPTITSPSMVQRGVILGTAAYVSPEQARGREADQRSDIWSFGAVLYEMLSGRRAFQGDDVADTIAAVLRQDVDWSALDASTPAPVRRLLARCLDRDTRRRLRDIGEARILLEDPATATVEGAWAPGFASARRPLWHRLLLPAAAAGVAGAVVVAALRPPTRSTATHVTRFALSTTAATALSVDAQSRDLTITPDGRHVVYKGGSGGSDTRLFVRELGQLDPRPLTAPGRPKGPFASPDGQWVGFFEPSGGVALKKVALTGGPSVELSRVDGPSRGGTWGEDDTIILATAALSTGLQRVSSAGGAPVVLTTPSAERGEGDHVWPHYLPGSHSVLFTITARTGGDDASQVAVLDVAAGSWKTVIRGASQAQYVPSGHLVYVAAGALWAVGFDLARMETTGTASQVVPQVVTLPTGTAEFDIARNGTLVYVPGEAEASPRTLVWVDRQGHEQDIAAPARPYVTARLSPDGTRVALEIEDQENDIWIWDLSRASLTRVTTDPGLDQAPAWTPDGRRLVFSSQAGGVLGSLFWQAADGTGAAERLTESRYIQRPSTVLADGGVLFMEAEDLMLFTQGKDRRVLPVVQTPQAEGNGEISPDGRWLAYDSNDSGPAQIFVRPFPTTTGGKTQVSTRGGSRPLWARNGRELFYLAPDGTLMSVSVAPGAAWSAGTPTRVVQKPYFGESTVSAPRPYDVSPDNQRFLMLKRSGDLDQPPPPATVVVVQNWVEELKRLVPVRR